MRIPALFLLVSLAHAAPPALEMKPKEIVHFDAPLSAKAQAMAALGGNTPAVLARCAVAVPEGFTPARAWPVFSWNAPQNSSAVEGLAAVAPAANDAGWIVLAADGATPAKLETTEWCAAMLAAAFDQLERAWPAVRRWPMAAGGFSGGAKRAPYIGAVLMESRYRVIGLFLGGVNEDRPTDALRWHKPGPAYKDVPIFLSGGTQDLTANPDEQEAVAASLKKSGFTHVRSESYDGEHELHTPHVSAALRWFTQAAPANGR